MTLAPIDLNNVDDLPDDNGVQIYIRDGKPGPRWEPDMHIVDAVLSMPKASRRLTEMELPDRCWLVAGLTVAGCTAENIAERCRCSVRLVRAVRAEPMTQLCEVTHAELQRQAAELRMERIEHAATRRDLWSANTTIDRQQKQIDQILSKLATGTLKAFPRCGHPKVDWNIYVHHGINAKGEPFAREYCRECNNYRATQYRERRKAADQSVPSHRRVMIKTTVAALVPSVPRP